jgi:hypothetical protein
MVSRLLLCGFFLLAALPTFAEDSVKTICENVVKYEGEGQIRKALEELAWAHNALNQANRKKIAELLPKTIGEYAGGEVKNADVMGMSTTEREYTAAGSTIKLSLVGSSAGAAKNAGNPFAAFGQLAAMGAGFDPGAKTVRLSGRAVTLKQEAGSENVEVTIPLKNGALVRLEAEGIKDSKKFEDTLAKMDLNPLEDYLS